MSKGNRTIRTDRARERFLAVLARNANVTEACRRARIGRTAAYQWRDEEPEFAAQWDKALEIAVERLEAEAWRRAVDGFEGRPVTYKGRVVCRVREYSDRVLELLLKAHKPDRYSERFRAEVSGPGGRPVHLKLSGGDVTEQEAASAYLELVTPPND